MSIRAFETIGPIASREHADLLLEVAFLVTSADGKLDPSEAAAFRELMGRVRGAEPSAADAGQLYDAFTKALGNTPPVERVTTLAPQLPTELGETAFRVGMALALVDRDASPHEDALIDALFHALGLEGARAEAIAKEVREAMSPPLDAPPPT